MIGRDADEAVMRVLADTSRGHIDGAAGIQGLDVRVQERNWLPPTRLGDTVAATLYELAVASGYRCRRMASGAGHDAQTFARPVASGLIFVPSVGGVSHAPEDWTDWADIECGATLLARAIASFAPAPSVP